MFSGQAIYVLRPLQLENQRRKHQKTDRLDARALLDNLESYLRGKRDAMSIVMGLLKRIPRNGRPHITQRR
jgi:hypothetical protein